ncbi:butyryl-CoA dehydrogenase [Arthrobacter silviterrae]|uniref:Medium-chain specific acyl-CoA dehydrogenase, mitochondrial n=1 Tax=Arthrobacter silviterrae TaxID=2026658 RepID=A0ABX0DH15_9MICC|nr:MULTISPECIES: acyl-CoA dehydrogenase family protein [Arthrobacter]MCU6478963.1 acyl-CoA dehydrogenase family protein [Arthrobacter sp. A2-55]MDQ0277953.1 butyryl-CoA dehydrogenase [Arthrobacter silviterrae]NGN83507.1 acyl-CoA dehydrogenase family protein [Arthrobacter silviterrae]
MDFRFTPRQIELKQRAIAWTEEMKQYELDCEMNNGLSAEQHEKVKQLIKNHGLAAINMPAEWGGAGLNTLEHAIVSEEVGKLTGALWDTMWRPANALKACTPAQREEFLIPEINGERRDAVAITEPEAGSDPQNIQTTAVRDGDSYIINGEKLFVTVGDAADFILLLASVDGAPTMFLVDKDLPGVSVKRTPRYTHTFVYEHPEFLFEDVRVGADKILGEIGQGYELTRDWFVEERLMIAARTIGAAERATLLAADYAKERVQFGKPILDFQLIQRMLAQNTVDIMTNRVLTYQVAWEADQGMDRKLLNAKAAVIKLGASEASNRCVDNALQIFGGRGYMRENPVERLWRELRVDRIWEGTSEIQTVIIGNEISKRGAEGLLGYAGAVAQ